MHNFATPPTSHGAEPRRARWFGWHGALLQDLRTPPPWHVRPGMCVHVTTPLQVNVTPTPSAVRRCYTFPTCDASSMPVDCYTCHLALPCSLTVPPGTLLSYSLQPEHFPYAACFTSHGTLVWREVTATCCVVCHGFTTYANIGLDGGCATSPISPAHHLPSLLLAIYLWSCLL